MASWPRGCYPTTTTPTSPAPTYATPNLTANSPDTSASNSNSWATDDRPGPLDPAPELDSIELDERNLHVWTQKKEDPRSVHHR